MMNVQLNDDELAAESAGEPCNRSSSDTAGSSSTSGPIWVVDGLTEVKATYDYGQSLLIGVTLVVVGVISIVLNVTHLCFADQYDWIIYFKGNGFWGGTMFTITGGFGIAASKSKHKLTISGFMAFSIVSIFLAVEQFVVGVRAASKAHRVCGHPDNWSWLEEQPKIQACWMGVMMTAMVGLLAAASVVAAVCCIRAVVICFRSVGCCHDVNFVDDDSLRSYFNQQDSRSNDEPIAAKADRSITTRSLDANANGPAALDGGRGRGRQESFDIAEYKHRQSMVLGVVLVVIGLLCLAFNVAHMCVIDTYTWSFLTGNGFYGGSMFIVSGSFGMVASSTKTRRMIISFMILDILSTLLAVEQFVTGVRSAATSHQLCVYGSHTYEHTPCHEGTIISAMEGCLAAVAVLAAIATVWGVVICGQALGCWRQAAIFKFTVSDAQKRDDVITASNSGQSVDWLSISSPDDVIATFDGRRVLHLGLVLVIVGVASVALNVINVIFVDKMTWFVMITGNGFWGGTVFFLSGCAAVVASRNRARMTITFLTVLSIISTSLAVLQLVVGIRGSIWSQEMCPYEVVKHDNDNTTDEYFKRMDMCTLGVVAIATQVSLAAAAMPAAVAAVWTLIISSRATGCCAAEPPSSDLATSHEEGTSSIGSDIEQHLPSTVVSTFNRRHSSFLGVALIVLGVLTNIFGIVDVSFVDQFAYHLLFVGNGFFSGTLYIVGGGVGIAASRNSRRLTVMAFLLLEVLTVFVAFEQLVVGVRGSVWSGHVCEFYYCSVSIVMRTMEGCLAAVGASALVASVWGLVICSRAIRCCTTVDVSQFGHVTSMTSSRQDSLTEPSGGVTDVLPCDRYTSLNALK